MTEAKTQITDVDPADFIAEVEPAAKSEEKTVESKSADVVPVIVDAKTEKPEKTVAEKPKKPARKTKPATAKPLRAESSDKPVDTKPSKAESSAKPDEKKPDVSAETEKTKPRVRTGRRPRRVGPRPSKPPTEGS